MSATSHRKSRNLPSYTQKYNSAKLLVNGELKTTYDRLDGTQLNRGGIMTMRWVDNQRNPMPYFRYEIQVLREPLNGAVAVLSDGIIIQGGADMEYPEYYNPNGSFVTIAKATFYTPENQKIGTQTFGRIVCREEQQAEYYPTKE